MELIARGLIKHYPGVVALGGVDLELHGGEVHAIVGENGAGKSSLMKLLSGAATPDGGVISIDGVPVQFAAPPAAHASGIRMIHQELSLIPAMTVAENIFLGAEPRRWGIVRRDRLQSDARAVLARFGRTDIPVDAPVGELSLATRQLVEIAKAVVQNAQLLIMDEPTAILAQHESEALFSLIRQLRDGGTAIAYITHRMDEVFALADRVTVLRDGLRISTGPLASYSRSSIVQEMIGRDLSAAFPPSLAPAGVEVLRLEALSAPGVQHATLSVAAGEIVGLVGLVGAGRTELLRAIFGAAPITGGTMILRGAPFRPDGPAAAIAAGLAFIPEDRKRSALVLDASVRVNSTLAVLRTLARGGVVDDAREAEAVQRWINALRIRTPSQQQPVRVLSGGNQQKVVLARWMLAQSNVLLVDEPTRGIDVGARAEIYGLLRELTAKGAAVLMVSSELPEAFGLSDRIVVMRNGSTVGELAGADATPDRVADLILGEARAA